VREAPTVEPPIVTLKAIHESVWLQERHTERDLTVTVEPDKVNLGGSMLLLLIGSPGIGKMSLENKVIYTNPGIYL